MWSYRHPASRITKLWGKTLHPSLKQNGLVIEELAMTKIYHNTYSTNLFHFFLQFCLLELIFCRSELSNAYLQKKYCFQTSQLNDDPLWTRLCRHWLMLKNTTVVRDFLDNIFKDNINTLCIFLFIKCTNM